MKFDWIKFPELTDMSIHALNDAMKHGYLDRATDRNVERVFRAGLKASKWWQENISYYKQKGADSYRNDVQNAMYDEVRALIAARQNRKSVRCTQP